MLFYLSPVIIGYDVVSLCLVPCFFALDPDRPDGIRVTAQPIERIREIQRSLQALVDQVEFSCPVSSIGFVSYFRF